MIAALMIGRAGSTGFPGKNVSLVLGRPLCEYPLMAVAGSANVDQIFISTDSDQIRSIGQQYNAVHIERPAHLATSTALSDDVFVHAFGVIKDHLKAAGSELEFLVLLFANAATVKTEFIDQGINMLRSDPNMDGVATTSIYNIQYKSRLSRRRLLHRWFNNCYSSPRT
jgi:CMP-N-acetylneuraminic acid synthetase